ncbi:hypothetical protein D9615_010660 [Tricholomella constricta]|uniref:Uncharacterized protein n=1 Tax=Tricholomella constricta TaxID=117010 RepID=A0A8H5GKD0_9AGAR|nr:hypothetical protein D9615_010660 [Tricholomella constricta]
MIRNLPSPDSTTFYPSLLRRLYADATTSTTPPYTILYHIQHHPSPLRLRAAPQPHLRLAGYHRPLVLDQPSPLHPPLPHASGCPHHHPHHIGRPYRTLHQHHSLQHRLLRQPAHRLHPHWTPQSPRPPAHPLTSHSTPASQVTTPSSSGAGASLTPSSGPSSCVVAFGPAPANRSSLHWRRNTEEADQTRNRGQCLPNPRTRGDIETHRKGRVREQREGDLARWWGHTAEGGLGGHGRGCWGLEEWVGLRLGGVWMGMGVGKGVGKMVEVLHMDVNPETEDEREDPEPKRGQAIQRLRRATCSDNQRRPSSLQRLRASTLLPCLPSLALHHLTAFQALRRCLGLPALEPREECRAWIELADLGMLQSEPSTPAYRTKDAQPNQAPVLRLTSSSIYPTILSARLASLKIQTLILRHLLSAPATATSPPDIRFAAHLALIHTHACAADYTPSAVQKCLAPSRTCTPPPPPPTSPSYTPTPAPPTTPPPLSKSASRPPGHAHRRRRPACPPGTFQPHPAAGHYIRQCLYCDDCASQLQGCIVLQLLLPF